MTSIFGNLTTEGLEDSSDRLGGFSPLDTAAYEAEVVAAYAGESAKGARNVSLILKTKDGKEYRETIYITNTKGENYYLNKNDKSKKVPLPGFTTIDDLCLVTSGVPLSDQEAEDKVINIYNYDSKKEEPTSVPMLTGLIGQTAIFGIQRNLENKNEKDGNGNYVPTAETRETNTIDKVFHAETKMTVPEAKAGRETADFYEKWVTKNTGNTRDLRKIKDGGAANNGAPPVAGASKAPRTSLFNK